MEDKFYYWCGLILTWGSTIGMSLFILCLLYEKVINKLAEVFKNMWTILEYQYYKKEFKEWIKTKKRQVKHTQF